MPTQCLTATGRVERVPWPMLSPRGSTQTQDIWQGDPEGHETRRRTRGPPACRLVVGHRVRVVPLHATHAEGLLRKPEVGADRHARASGDRRAGDLVALRDLGYDQHTGSDRARFLVGGAVGSHQVALAQLTLL